MIRESDAIYNDALPAIKSLKFELDVVDILLLINFSYLVQHIATFLFTKKAGRFYRFPTALHFTDLSLFVSSFIIYFWINFNIHHGLDYDLTETEFYLRFTNNVRTSRDFGLQYSFAINILCLIIRFMFVLEFNTSIGPLTKILGKMTKDYFNYTAMFCLMTLMYSIVGNILFMLFLEEYDDFLSAVLTIVNTLLGNYAFARFDTIENPAVGYIGIAFTILVAFTYNFVFLLFLTAMLANTYNTFENKSNGLYLSRILNSRDEMTYDSSYGAFLASVPPTNIVQLPFIPFCLLSKPREQVTEQVNEIIMKIQYTLIMSVYFFIYAAVGLFLIPAAYVVGVFDKLATMDSQSSADERLYNNLVFIPCGMGILLLDFIADLFYFWKHNFQPQSQLKKIIIEREATTVSHKSIRLIIKIFEKYTRFKIKTSLSLTLIKNFQTIFEV